MSHKQAKVDLSYRDMMALRSAYTNGLKTPETRAVAAQYVHLRRMGKLQEFKEKASESS